MAFSYYKTVTVDKTKVPSTQTNFPVLVSVTDADLKTVGNGGFVQNASGFDVGFYADSAAATKYDWETERYIATTGEVIYHVRIPSLSSATDTVFYMFFGDSGISTDQSNKTGVWDSNFKGVWHLPDGTTLTALDSTSSANDGTLSGSPLPVAGTGKVGGGGVFTAANVDSVTLASASNAVANLNAYTLEGWYKGGTTFGILYAEGSTSNNTPVALLHVNINVSTNAGFYHRDDATTASDINGTVISDSVWHYLVGVRSASNAFELFVDGTSAGTSTSAPSTTTVDNTRLAILHRASDSYPLEGSLDEVRVSHVARSANWITTTWNNLNSPSTFESFGTKTAAGGGAVTLMGQQLT